MAAVRSKPFCGVPVKFPVSGACRADCVPCPSVPVSRCPGVVWCPCPACLYNPATRAGNRQHGPKHNASPAGFAAAGVGVGVGVSSGRGCGLRRWWLSFARWQCNRGGLPLQTTLLPRPACPVCAGFVYNQRKPGKSPARRNPAKSDNMKMNYKNVCPVADSNRKTPKRRGNKQPGKRARVAGGVLVYSLAVLPFSLL